MKTINEFIQEKFELNKNTVVQEKIYTTNIVDFQKFLNSIKMEKSFIKDFERSTTNELYWICVTTNNYLTSDFVDKKVNFATTFIKNTKYETDSLIVHTKYKDLNLNKVQKLIPNANRLSFLYNTHYHSLQFVINITEVYNINTEKEKRNQIVYVVSANKDDIQTVYNLFMNDNWKPYPLDIYKLFNVKLS